MQTQSSTTVAPYVHNTLAKADVSVDDVTGFYVKMIRVVGGTGQQATGEAYVIVQRKDGSERIIFHAKGSKVTRRRGAHEFLTETQYSTKQEIENIWTARLGVPIITTSSRVEDNMKSSQGNKYATVHGRLRTLGVTNEGEQRNIYAAITGKRSLREMSNGERKNLEQWLLKQIKAEPKNAPIPNTAAPVSDEAAQALLD